MLPGSFLIIENSWYYFFDRANSSIDEAYRYQNKLQLLLGKIRIGDLKRGKQHIKKRDIIKHRRNKTKKWIRLRIESCESGIKLRWYWRDERPIC